MNEYRGEVGIDIDGTRCTLCYDWNAIARLKSELGLDFDAKISQAVLDLDLDVFATALVIGLNRHHPEIAEDDVKKASPPLAVVSNAITEALNLAFHGKKEAPEQPEENPPMNGATSSRKGGKSRSKRG